MTQRTKSAIVTGGTGALGSVVVRTFLASDIHVAVPYHSEKSLDASNDLTNNSQVFFAKADLADEQEVGRFISDVEARFGRIDVLVNIAGGYIGGKTIADVSVDEWEAIMSLNLRTAFLMCRAVLPHMNTQKFGRIVNIASMIALTPEANKGPYAVSKRGVITLTEAIAQEVKGTGITANAIAPSIVVTEANKQWMTKKDEGKWVTPEEIASLIHFLCSDMAGSISGNTIKIYGGV